MNQLSLIYIDSNGNLCRNYKNEKLIFSSIVEDFYFGINFNYEHS